MDFPKLGGWLYGCCIEDAAYATLLAMARMWRKKGGLATVLSITAKKIHCLLG
jgi:hypothetical protein